MPKWACSLENPEPQSSAGPMPSARPLFSPLCLSAFTCSANPSTVLWRSLSFLQLTGTASVFFPHVCGSHFAVLGACFLANHFSDASLDISTWCLLWRSFTAYKHTPTNAYKISHMQRKNERAVKVGKWTTKYNNVESWSINEHNDKNWRTSAVRPLM